MKALGKRVAAIADAREIADAHSLLDRVFVWASATQLHPDHELDRIRADLIRDVFPRPGESLDRCKQRIAAQVPAEPAATPAWWRAFEDWDVREGR